MDKIVIHQRSFYVNAVVLNKSKLWYKNYKKSPILHVATFDDEIPILTILDLISTVIINSVEMNAVKF